MCFRVSVTEESQVTKTNTHKKDKIIAYVGELVEPPEELVEKADQVLRRALGGQRREPNYIREQDTKKLIVYIVIFFFFDTNLKFLIKDIPPPSHQATLRKISITGQFY